MTLLDLSQVTLSLCNLIRLYVQASPAWPAANTVTVSPQPADRLAGDNVLGFYLYHTNESAAFKNLPSPGMDVPPVRFVPMGLELHYQLTPHSDLPDDAGTLREQLMFGLALKTFHDFPVVDQTTQIGGTTVFTPALAAADNNRLKITLQPLPAAEAVEYWTAGTSPMRLAAYYQISVVALEPEEPQRHAGRVLSYGVYTFTAQTPRLYSSHHVLSFTLPGATETREVEVRPAQVPIGGRVTFEGDSLTGDSLDLLLRNERWDAPQAVDNAWNLVVAGNRVEADVQESTGTEDILPGIYGAIVRVVRRRQTPDGQTRDFTYLSNECPFTIIPDIQNVSAPTAAGLVTVTGRFFQHPDLLPENVQVYVADALLATGAAGSLNAGEFAVVDATHLEARLPAGLTPADHVPLRILVNGAESPPRWVLVP